MKPKMSVLVLALGGFLSFSLLHACKKANQSQFGSYFDEAANLEPVGGTIRALTGMIDFEVPNIDQAGASDPTVGDPPPLSGNSADSVGVRSTGAGVTLRMQFSVVFDFPVADLNEIANGAEKLARVGTLNTFNVVHEPGDARVDMETIGRPLYLANTADPGGDPSKDCLQDCLRLVTGAGKLTDWSDVVILNFIRDGDSWVLDWYNYFGVNIKDRPMPVEAVFVDKFDGAQQ
jgi:hypothetical protein